MEWDTFDIAGEYMISLPNAGYLLRLRNHYPCQKHNGANWGFLPSIFGTQAMERAIGPTRARSVPLAALPPAPVRRFVIGRVVSLARFATVECGWIEV